MISVYLSFSPLSLILIRFDQCQNRSNRSSCFYQANFSSRTSSSSMHMLVALTDMNRREMIAAKKKKQGRRISSDEFSLLAVNRLREKEMLPDHFLCLHSYHNRLRKEEEDDVTKLVDSLEKKKIQNEKKRHLMLDFFCLFVVKCMYACFSFLVFQ